MWTQTEEASRHSLSATAPYHTNSAVSLAVFNRDAEVDSQAFRFTMDNVNSTGLRQDWNTNNLSRTWHGQSSSSRESSAPQDSNVRRSNDTQNSQSYMEPLLFEHDMSFGQTGGQPSPSNRFSASLTLQDVTSTTAPTQFNSSDQNWSRTSHSAYNSSEQDETISSTPANNGSNGHASATMNNPSMNQDMSQLMLESAISQQQSNSQKQQFATSNPDSSQIRFNQPPLSSVPYMSNSGLPYIPLSSTSALQNDMNRWPAVPTLPSLGAHMNPQSDQNRHQFHNSGHLPHIAYQQHPFLANSVYQDQNSILGIHGMNQNIRNIPTSSNTKVASWNQENFNNHHINATRQPIWSDSLSALPNFDDGDTLIPPNKMHRRNGSTSSSGHIFSKNLDSYSPARDSIVPMNTCDKSQSDKYDWASRVGFEACPDINGFQSGPDAENKANEVGMSNGLDSSTDNHTRTFQPSGAGIEGLGALVAAGAHVEGVPSQNGPLAPPPVSMETRMYMSNTSGQGSGPSSRGYTYDGQHSAESFVAAQHDHQSSMNHMDIDTQQHLLRRTSAPNDLAMWHNLAAQNRRASAGMADGRNRIDQIPELWSQHKAGVSALENNVFHGSIMAPISAESNSEKDLVERYDATLWALEESIRLQRLVEVYGTSRWSEVARNLPGKSEMQCLLHWRYALNDDQQVRGIGSWSVEEDARLKALVELQGTKWAMVARSMPGRVAKQCRERYLNHLDPGLHRGPWSEEEEQQLLRLCEGSSRQWAEICRQLPGRSYNDVKNRYNLIQRRLRRIQRASKESSPDLTKHHSPIMKTELEVNIDYSTSSPTSQSLPSSEEINHKEESRTTVDDQLTTAVAP